MAKIYQILGVVGVIGLLLFFWFKHEREAAKNEIIIEQQQEIIEEKTDVIETKNRQQKLISKPALSSDVAARDEWLQLLWQKADQVN